MKQHISIENLNELTDEQKEKLREWWKAEINSSMEKGVYSEETKEILPLLSIGQCIQFLIENCKLDEGDPYPSLTFHKQTDEYCMSNLGIGLFWEGRREGRELIDALWEAIKAVL